MMGTLLNPFGRMDMGVGEGCRGVGREGGEGLGRGEEERDIEM